MNRPIEGWEINASSPTDIPVCVLTGGTDIPVCALNDCGTKLVANRHYGRNERH